MNVALRSAAESDAHAVTALTAQLGYAVSEPEVSERLARIVTRDAERFVVAEIDRRVVGWLHAVECDYVDAERFVTIAGLVVDRDYRGQGIGRLLLECGEAWAANRGFAIVRLASSVGRSGAHRFYERLGYRNVKTQYSFAKSLTGKDEGHLDRLVPRLEG